MDALGLTFTVLPDPDLSAIRAFGVLDERLGTAWPATFIVGRTGKVVWRSLEDSYKKRPAAAAVVEALAALRGGGT